MVVPPDAIGDGDTVTVDCERLTAPGTTVTVGNVEVTACRRLPPIVAVIVLLPSMVAVNVAVYVPLLYDNRAEGPLGSAASEAEYHRQAAEFQVCRWRPGPSMSPWSCRPMRSGIVTPRSWIAKG